MTVAVINGGSGEITDLEEGEEVFIVKKRVVRGINKRYLTVKRLT